MLRITYLNIIHFSQPLYYSNTNQKPISSPTNSNTTCWSVMWLDNSDQRSDFTKSSHHTPVPEITQSRKQLIWEPFSTTHTDTQTHMHTCAHTHIHVRTHTHTYTHVRTHTNPHTRKRAGLGAGSTLTQTHMCELSLCVCVCVCVCGDMFKRMCLCECARESVCVYSSDGDRQKGTAGVCVFFTWPPHRQRQW